MPANHRGDGGESFLEVRLKRTAETFAASIRDAHMPHVRMLSEKGLHGRRKRLAVAAPTRPELHDKRSGGLIDLVSRWLVVVVSGIKGHWRVLRATKAGQWRLGSGG
jgi:hypothetical protein